MANQAASGRPADDRPAEREKLLAVGRIERFRRIVVEVRGPATMSGKIVRVVEREVEVASTQLAMKGKQALGSAVLPIPPIGRTFGRLELVVDGEKMGVVDMPDVGLARQRQMEQMGVVFRPSVFSGTSFPKGELEEPSLAEDLIGRYSLSTQFYDAEMHPVKTAAEPGRYGAVTTITSEHKATFLRYRTLFRQPGKAVADWEEWDADRFPELPAELGIDPAVAKAFAPVIGSYFANVFGQSFNTTSRTAALLAGLYESEEERAPVPMRLSPLNVDRDWWFALRTKLGDAPRYKYTAILPEGYEQHPEQEFPLLLFLHGSGEVGDDPSIALVHGPHKYLADHHNPFVIIIPQCPPRQTWHPMQLKALLDEVSVKYRLDPQRLYLTGLSMGGYGVWDTIACYPGRFAAAVPICGRGDSNDVARLSELPIWVFHGMKDSVVPVQRSYEMVSALSRVAGRVKYTFYPDLNHDSWTRAYNDPQVYEWLLQQKRDQPQQEKLREEPRFPKQ